MRYGLSKFCTLDIVGHQVLAEEYRESPNKAAALLSVSGDATAQYLDA